MSERASLLALLVRLRRRLRVLATADGAVRGGAAGLAALAVALAFARWRGGTVPAAAAVGLVIAGMALGAALFGLRRIALARCARLADRALDEQDRVLSALSFATSEGGLASDLARAAVADAVARAGALSPARVAPARRPRGLPFLAAAGLAAALSAVFPARAPAARLDVARARPPAEGAPRIAAARLDAERDEARRLAEAAKAFGDEELAAQASELAATIRALTDGTLPHGEALDRLQRLMERAAEGAATADSRRGAVGAIGRALEESPPTKALGAALAAGNGAASEQALGALAARAAEASAGERGELARALDAAAAAGAAAGAAGAAGNPSASDSGRRLKRDHAQGNPPAGGASEPRNPDRRLQRLSRDLGDMAAACRENPDACKRRIDERGGDLPRMARETQRADVWRKLKNAARQMRERLRRGDLGDDSRRLAERMFRRAARGAPGQGGDDPGEMSDSDEGQELVEGDGEDGEMSGLRMEGDGDGEDGSLPGQGEGSSSASAASAAAAAAAGQNGEGDGQGEGIGSQAGRDPLGRKAEGAPARGHEREARLRGGSGPTRSQVIEMAARRGFAHGAYDRVFTDYQAVVEESLEAGAVPEGRRYVVRRYFQLIRPRFDQRRNR